MDDARMRNEIEQEVTNAMEDQARANVAKGQLAALEESQTQAARDELMMRAGRVQMAHVMTEVGTRVSIEQLREMRELSQSAKIPWSQVCEKMDISRQHANRLLKQGDALGDEFWNTCSGVGLSFRTVETARQLPAPVREKLTQGEVIDLEDVGKEQLTRVIKELADEHAEERAEAEKEAKKKDKALEKSEAKNTELTEKVEALETENRALSSGLDAGDASTWEQIQAIEKAFVMGIVRIRNTPGMQEMSAMLYNRIAASLLFMEALARDTSMHLATKREEGELAGEDWGYEESRELARQLAGVDNTEPYPI